MPRFYSLPPEIQNMILNFVAEPSTSSSTPQAASTPEKSNLAPYACVDKFWNSFFESRIFNNLIIKQDDIPTLSQIVGRQRRLFLRHLWLRIELPKYLTSTIKEEEKPKILWALDSVFTKSISDLWDVLSVWDSTRHIGMTLELSAFSPRDWNNFLAHNCTVEKDVELYKRYLTSGSTEQYEAVSDIHESYVNLHHAIRNVPRRNDYWFPTVNNLFGWKPLEFTKDVAQLPPVSIVTKFLIRRQQFREIYPTALETVLTSLTDVQEIHVERWRCAESSDEKMWCKEAQIAFGMSLPPSVKRLSLYGETSKVFHTWEPKKATVVSLTKTLRQYTRHLESLSISHLIDAKEFLRPFYSENGARLLPDWRNLKRLSLTSEIFKTGTEKDINDLLCAAARVTKKMPKLEMLELWNGEAACVFCYRVEDTVGEITWRGIHFPILDNEVVRTWEAASTNNNRPDVRESAKPIKVENIVSSRQVLKYVTGKYRILHPVSVSRAILKRKRGKSADYETGGRKRARNYEVKDECSLAQKHSIGV
ncbi:hypothetical protein FSHL1_010556 [Fusarium sambucinum]